jgi:hypothetical protein
MGRILKCEVFFLAHRNPKQANCITGVTGVPPFNTPVKGVGSH